MKAAYVYSFRYCWWRSALFWRRPYYCKITYTYMLLYLCKLCIAFKLLLILYMINTANISITCQFVFDLLKIKNIFILVLSFLKILCSFKKVVFTIIWNVLFQKIRILIYVTNFWINTWFLKLYYVPIKFYLVNKKSSFAFYTIYL